VFAPLGAAGAAFLVALATLGGAEETGPSPSPSSLPAGSSPLPCSSGSSAVATAPLPARVRGGAGTGGLGLDRGLRFGLVVAAQRRGRDVVGVGRHVASTSAIRSRRRMKPGSRSFQAVSTGEAMNIDE